MKTRPSHSVTFDLAEGDTRALLVNALAAYALLLEEQSAEQERFKHHDYAHNLTKTADEARALLSRVEQASGEASDSRL